MGIKSFFSNAAKWLFGLIKSTAKATQEDILNDIKGMAFSVVEDVTNTDLNGDGRVAAVSEVALAAQTTGFKYLRKLFANGQEAGAAYLASLTDSDLKRYVSLARLATQTVEKYGLDKTPTVHIILGIIQYVLGEEE